MSGNMAFFDLVALDLVALPGGPLPGGSTWWLYLVALPGAIGHRKIRWDKVLKLCYGLKKIAQMPCKSMVYDTLNNYYHKF